MVHMVIYLKRNQLMNQKHHDLHVGVDHHPCSDFHPQKIQQEQLLGDFPSTKIHSLDCHKCHNLLHTTSQRFLRQKSRCSNHDEDSPQPQDG